MPNPFIASKYSNLLFIVLLPEFFFIFHITTVTLKWNNRSLNLLKYSLLQEIPNVRQFEFVT